MSRRSRSWSGLILGVLLASGCGTLPVDGPVHTQPDTSDQTSQQVSYFVPPGPVPGASREEIVRGFLLATQANPASTSVARSFLANQARSSWRPIGTVVYDTATVEPTATGIEARLSSTHRLDPYGRWIDEFSGSINLGFNLTLENGQWRIQNPPQALPVPASYFSSLYVPYLLYFFDRSGTVLVPSRVYLPPGGQVASSLVRGLLAGPIGPGAQAVTSAFGRSLDLDLSVVMGSDGVADIPLSAGIQRLSQADLYRAVVQLAATLRQLPGVLKIRISVDGIAVPLFNGQSAVGVSLAPGLDPVRASGTALVGVAGSKVVDVLGSRNRAVDGPFGSAAFALRSVAMSAKRAVIAGVAENGRRAYEAPATGSSAPARVRTVITGASNLLPPVYDRFGGLWLVDAAKGGAVVHLVLNGRDRVLEVPGVSGQRVAAFTITRDGATLVAATGRAGTPTLLVSSLARAESGGTVRALTARRITVTGADPAPVIALGQNSATTVVVLTRPAASEVRMYSTEIDGSPGETPSLLSNQAPGDVIGLAVSPDPRLGLRLVTSTGALLSQSSTGEWKRVAAGLRTARYIE